MGPRVRAVALVQGLYFALTGLWPLLHLRSFMAVTGPKTDTWLVHTVALLVLALGLALLWAARRDRLEPGLVLAAAGQAAALALVDVVFVTRGRIRPVYLADAAGELVLLLAWVWAWRGRKG